MRQKLVEASERYGITSSEMSLVAVVQRADDEGGSVPKTKIVPIGMPQHTQFNSYFGGRALFSLDVGAQFASSRFRKIGKTTVFSETSRSRQKTRAMLASPLRFRPAPEAEADGAENNLLSSLRDAIRTIDNHASIRTGKDMNVRIAEILTKLVANEDRAENDAQKSALAALIDFLSSDVIDFLDTGHFDLGKWGIIRQQLEAAWAGLIDVEASKVPRQPVV
jgi:hypothetical protein